ncbi:hypothetical protein B0T17DRAFT_615905 [Bombardia bombarda]|uniref:Uncharacterized protein n=1 Tax=Bombardia bombarda TaxID=252184 RepID=A0AA40CAG7_9PEZI|nr:hypothetical protein B0T17DRAFT_615905 [Bombardia bombarda]
MKNIPYRLYPPGIPIPAKAVITKLRALAWKQPPPGKKDMVRPYYWSHPCSITSKEEFSVLLFSKSKSGGTTVGDPLPLECPNNNIYNNNNNNNNNNQCCSYQPSDDTTILYNSYGNKLQTLGGENLLKDRFVGHWLLCCHCGEWMFNMLPDNPGFPCIEKRPKGSGCDHCVGYLKAACAGCAVFTKYGEADKFQDGAWVLGGPRSVHDAAVKARLERERQAHIEK